MMRNAWVVGIVSFLLLAVLNGLAYQYFWYWRYPWSDKPMHFLGGMALAGFFVAWLGGRLKSVWPILGLVVLVGLGWEFFEFKFRHFLPATVIFKTLPVWERGGIDTLGDLAAGLAGALLVSFYFIHGRTKEDQA